MLWIFVQEQTNSKRALFWSFNFQKKKTEMYLVNMDCWQTKLTSGGIYSGMFCYRNQTTASPPLYQVQLSKTQLETISKCRNNTNCRAENNLIRLKNTAPKTESKNISFLPGVSVSGHWTEHTLQKDLEVPSSGFHLLQMLISSPTRRQDLEKHLEGKHHSMSFCTQMQGFGIFPLY